MYRVWIDWKPTSNERHAVVCKLYVAQAQFSQTKEQKKEVHINWYDIRGLHVNEGLRFNLCKTFHANIADIIVVGEVELD